jgi:betaine-aldehyde dehydrogenase
MLEHDRLFIGGDWVEPSGSDRITVIEAATEEPLGSVPDGTPADIDRAVASARRAFDDTEWARTDPAERGAILERISAGIATRGDELAELISRENGSPVLFSKFGQVAAPQLVAGYYGGLVKEFPFTETRAGMLGEMQVWREPVGVVAAIVPWNVPLFVTMTKLAPAISAGCTVVLKPAPETPLDAYVLAEILTESGLPEGVVNIVAAGRETGEYLVSHRGIDKVAFTGSSAAGRRIASICGENLTRVSLELGGKSAAIILDDADLDQTIPPLLGAALMNNGQACVAQTRILASRTRYDEVAEALSTAVGAMAVGDPLDAATAVGPLVAERQRDRVEGYLRIGQEEGAKVAVGGGRPASVDRGWFVEPTVFVNVDNTMRIAQEEIFGPVLAVIPYDDDAEAVRIANDSDYGLAGTVWTADRARGLDVARRVRAGTYGVNMYTLDFGAPFGGYKSSGIGRELGPEGLATYLELKSVAVAPES